MSWTEFNIGIFDIEFIINTLKRLFTLFVENGVFEIQDHAALVVLYYLCLLIMNLLNAEDKNG